MRHIAHMRNTSKQYTNLIKPYEYTIWLVLKSYYLPFKKGMTFYLNKLESPLPNDELWRRSLNVVNVFSPFHYYLSFEKGCGP